MRLILDILRYLHFISEHLISKQFAILTINVMMM